MEGSFHCFPLQCSVCLGSICGSWDISRGNSIDTGGIKALLEELPVSKVDTQLIVGITALGTSPVCHHYEGETNSCSRKEINIRNIRSERWNKWVWVWFEWGPMYHWHSGCELFWGAVLTTERWGIKNKKKMTVHFLALLFPREGFSFLLIPHGSTCLSIQGVSFPFQISLLSLWSLFLAAHPSRVWKWKNVAISMINGFLHWIAITGFNQFIIPPSFWVLTVTLWELIELASPQSFPTKRSCLTIGDFGC